jgi:ADP-ribose pyrophosphatase YjhB (NUDIX family)
MKNETDINAHVVLVAAFILKKNKILLARRSKSDPQAGGLWSIPGGKVDLEVGKSVIENTLKKEIKEEVGIEIEDKIFYLGSEAFTRVSGHHVIALIYLAYWKSGKAKPLEDQEEVQWLRLDQLDKNNVLPDFLKSKLKLLTNFLENKF